MVDNEVNDLDDY